MGSMQRRKGRNGENECRILLESELGLTVQRNWQEQAAHGGVDLIGIPGWAIEVKRAKTYSNTWFEQAVRQAGKNTPVLLFRLDRQKWKAEVRGSDLIPELSEENETVTMSIEAFCTIVRERLSMVGSYKRKGCCMGEGEGYRPQMVLDIMLDLGEAMTSEDIRKHTSCTDRRIFGSLLSRMYKDGLVCRSGIPRSMRGNKPAVGAYRYWVTPDGLEWLKKFGPDVGQKQQGADK